MINSQYLFWIKVVISGLMIAGISSLAKTFPKLAAILTALPAMTFLSMIWIYLETKDKLLLQRYVTDVFIWLIPSVFFFVVAMLLLKTRLSFWLSLGLSTASLLFGIYIMRWFKL